MTLQANVEKAAAAVAELVISESVSWHDYSKNDL